MTGPLRLVVFDVDGTLADGQSDIVAAMTHAFGRAGQPAPPREAVLGIVGLSLDVAIPRLAPALAPETHASMVAWYREAYIHLRARSGAADSSPLYPHAREIIEALHSRPELLLGVATGKSRRGLDLLLQAHDLSGFFVTRQVSDDHPSKPHPSMLHAALSETGVPPENAVMVGDTSYDIDMARAAGMAAVGVGWGYHRREALAGATVLIDDFRELPGAIDKLWEAAA